MQRTVSAHSVLKGGDALAVLDAVQTTSHIRNSWLYVQRKRKVVRMGWRRIVGFLVLALVIFFIITQPETAAESVQSIGATLRDAADSITTFFTRLV
jgi:hypothetical protein